MPRISNKNIFVTGAIQIGKSTVINKVLKRHSDFQIGGFRTLPIFEGELRKGFVLQSFDGRQKVFAHRDMQSQHVHDVYRFDLSVFESFGVELLDSALRNSQMIIMDEIGQMERNAIQFRKKIFQCLDSDTYVLGAVQQRSRWFIDKICKRNDTDIIVIDNSNRVEIPEHIFFI